jgi:hypothetical protein
MIWIYWDNADFKAIINGRVGRNVEGELLSILNLKQTNKQTDSVGP